MATQNSDARGVSSAVAPGLAFIGGVLLTMVAQQRLYKSLRLRAERAEQSDQREARLAEQQRFQTYLLDKALSDPDLAAVMSTIEEADATRRRQYLFANAMYTNAVLAYRVGVVNLEELHGHLRVICQNAIFREYWAATHHHRASLKASSTEARVGRMTDTLIRDLEVSDTEEWWVVGEPPTEEDQS